MGMPDGRERDPGYEAVPAAEPGESHPEQLQTQWRPALISAGITTFLAVLVLVIGYERMRSDSEADAGAAGRAAKVRPAEASDRAGSSGTGTPPAAAQLAAGPTR